MPIGGSSSFNPIPTEEIWQDVSVILPNNFVTNYFYDEEVDLTGVCVKYHLPTQSGEEIEWKYKYYEDNPEYFSVEKDTDGYVSSGYRRITYNDGWQSHTAYVVANFLIKDRYKLNVVSLSLDCSEQNPAVIPLEGKDAKDCVNSMTVEKMSKRYNTSADVPYYYIKNGSSTSLIFRTSTTQSTSIITYSQAVNPVETHKLNVGISVEPLGEDIEFTSIDIPITFRKPIALDVSGTDGVEYYIGRQNIFINPSNLTYKLIYNDNTEEIIYDTSFLYHLTENDNVPLVSGESVLSNNPSILWVYRYVSVAYEGSTIYSATLKATYDVQYKPDGIVSVEILNEYVEFILGNKLEEQRNKFTIKATYESGYIDNNFQNYTFDNINYILEPLTEDISITIGSNIHKTLDYTKLSGHYVNPELDTLIVSNLGSTALSNKLEGFNFTNTKIKATFSNASYEKEYVFGRIGTGLIDYYEISSDIHTGEEDLDWYNGNEPIDLTMEEGYQDVIVTFSVKNIFDNTNIKSIDVHFTIFDIINITGISVDNPFIEYKVGEVFPKDDDNTMVTIYWEQQVGGNDAFLRKQIPLKSGFGSLSIQPFNETLRNVNYAKTIKISSVLNSNVYTTYNIQVKPRELLDEDKTIVLSAHLTTDPNVLELKDEHNVIYGWIKNVFDKNKNARVVLIDDFLSPIDGMANIEVTFPSYHEGEADKINNCHFGCLFGANNAVNRLFVSGNREIGNADWHTAELNLTDYEGEIEMTNGNFSYIPSESVMYYGETDNAICGYEIVSNDKLLVLKTKSDKEKTVYFRTPTLLKALDSSGNEQTDINGETLVQEEFSLVKGNNSVAGISPKSILNLNGDLLFVSSDNEVVGLDLVGIVGDNQRYANSRSKAIDKKLHELDLSDCIFWTNNKYAFLSIKGYGLFVTHFEARTENQYEWWYLTSNNPTTFIEIDDEIYFGNDDGSFSKMFNGTWRDVKKLFIRRDQTVLISIYPDIEEIGVDSSIIEKMDTKTSYKFRTIEGDEYTKDIYFKVGDIRTTPDNNTDFRINGDSKVLELVSSNIERREKLLKSIADNKLYYLNVIDEDKVEGEPVVIDCDKTTVDNPFIDCFGKPFKMQKVLEGDLDYTSEVERYRLLVKENGEWVQTTVGRLHNARLCEKLINDVDVVDLNKTTNRFKLKENGDYLNIVPYGNQTTQEIARGEIREYRDVDALYITAPLLANSLNTFKTVWQVTMTNDTDIDSALQVCIASNKVPYSETKQLETAGRLGVDLNAFAFFDVDYDKVVVPRTYTINRTLPMQKFLCFGFRNKSGYNAVLSEMAVTYTLPFPSYGSD